MKKIVAAGAVCLIAGIAGPAYAHTPTPSAKALKAHVKLSPSKGIKSGTAIHLTGKKGLKKTDYSCIQVIVHNGDAGEGTSNLSTIVNTKSNKKGTFKCTEVFKPFTGLDGSRTVHCPTTKAEAKDGYSCAIAYFDTGTSGKKSAGFKTFKAKK